MCWAGGAQWGFFFKISFDRKQLPAAPGNTGDYSDEKEPNQNYKAEIQKDDQNKAQ